MEQKDNNGIIIYQDENGVTKVSVRFSDEDVWLTQQQLAEIYETTQENVSIHISNYCCPVKPRFRDFSSRNPSKYGT